MKGKNANPFLMIGSWLGVIFFIILGYFTIPILYTKLNVNNWTVSLFGLLFPSSMKYFNFIFFLIIVYLAIGFLFGWAITSIIRKTRK